MNSLFNKADLAEIKLEIITKAIENKKLTTLSNGLFFKTFSQIEASGKINTHNKIWLGRMLREANNNKPVNISKEMKELVIFQEPNQFKKIRKFK